MVGKAGKGLGADDVRCAPLDKLHHLAGEQPTLSHHVAQVDDLSRTLGAMLDIANGLEPFGGGQGLADGLAQNVLRCPHRRLADGVLLEVGRQLLVPVHLVGDAKQEEVEESRDVGLTPFGLNHIHHLVVCRGMELH